MEEIPPKKPKKPPQLRAKSLEKAQKRPHKPRKAGELCQTPGNSGQRARYEALSPAAKAERIWRHEVRPAAPRAGSTRSTRLRNVAKANAYCDWSDDEHSLNLYRVCAVLNELDLGETYCIDHVVPLTSPLVCGLHTHTNLRITPVRENRAKSNLLWPDMWPQDWGTMDLILSVP